MRVQEHGRAENGVHLNNPRKLESTEVQHDPDTTTPRASHPSGSPAAHLSPSPCPRQLSSTTTSSMCPHLPQARRNFSSVRSVAVATNLLVLVSGVVGQTV